MTGKDSTHALREIQEAIGNVELLSREDEELLKKKRQDLCLLFSNILSEEMRCEVRKYFDSQHHASGDNADKVSTV